jgi:hypothetical protein
VSIINIFQYLLVDGLAWALDFGLRVLTATPLKRLLFSAPVPLLTLGNELPEANEKCTT